MSARLDDIDEKLKDSIALRIIELRKTSGKGQSEFARELMTKDKQALHRVEKGRGASIYTINKFCSALEISLSEFFDSPLFR
jgi:transcriptional regulator with XRE-family HTH domain